MTEKRQAKILLARAIAVPFNWRQSMAGPHEKLEQAEHTAHVPSKHIGLTMALIGVLIAFCAAMVGSQRNELTRTLIEQTQAHSDYSSASTKFRLIMMELEKLRRGLPADVANTVSIPSTLSRL
jgi:hypothetical protein